MGSQSGGKSEATMVWGVGVWNIYIEINREKKIINHIWKPKDRKEFNFLFKKMEQNY